MEDKKLIMSVDDKLGVAIALIKTANLAVGNMEYFGADGQSVAITLDMASMELEDCRELLNPLVKEKEV